MWQNALTTMEMVYCLKYSQDSEAGASGFYNGIHVLCVYLYEIRLLKRFIIANCQLWTIHVWPKNIHISCNVLVLFYYSEWDMVYMSLWFVMVNYTALINCVFYHVYQPWLVVTTKSIILL